MVFQCLKYRAAGSQFESRPKIYLKVPFYETGQSVFLTKYHSGKLHK